ncbi:MAG: hypothetical protein QOG94_182 [Solirubrobacteraceae bacterium]|nr:hypothetical protein [Solirubrobacteraceae bacterium]
MRGGYATGSATGLAPTSACESALRMAVRAPACFPAAIGRRSMREDASVTDELAAINGLRAT